MTTRVISADIGCPAKMTDVPDGVWPGVASGYQVSAVCGHGKWFFVTEDGVRGFGIGCLVTAKDGVITVRVPNAACKDCGAETSPGIDSARCAECYKKNRASR